MSKPDLEEEERRIVWERIKEAALRHHNRDKVFGIQKVISADTGLGTAAVSKWAKAKSIPERKTLRKLAELYDVSVPWLMGREDDGGGRQDQISPREAVRHARDITALVVSEMLPNGTASQFLWVMERACDLLLEGDENTALASLVKELKYKKIEWREEAESRDSSEQNPRD